MTTTISTATNPSHKWHVSPLPPSSTVTDITAWTRTQYAAFVGTSNPLHDTLCPPAHAPTPADIAKAVSRHLAALKADPEHVVFVHVVDEETGQVAGGAKWCFYEDDAVTRGWRPKRVGVDWAGEEGGEEREFAQKVMDEFHGRRVERMRGAHALLDLCFTHPAYERQGVASALVAYGVRKADENGWKVFTEASPRGQPVYARQGFVTTEAVSLNWERWSERPPVVWYHMEREPTTDGTG